MSTSSQNIVTPQFPEYKEYVYLSYKAFAVYGNLKSEGVKVSVTKNIAHVPMHIIFLFQVPDCYLAKNRIFSDTGLKRVPTSKGRSLRCFSSRIQCGRHNQLVPISYI